MADRAPTDLPVPTREQVIEFLRSKNPTGTACPICNSRSWNLGREPIDYLTCHIMQKDMVNTVLGGTVTPTVLLACNNCGYIREHSAIVIANWVQKNGQ